MARPADYRELLDPHQLEVAVISQAESNLRVAATSLDLALARTALAKARNGVEACIENFPSFLSSLAPLQLPRTVPAIGLRMAEAARRAGVGPMAAVAGAIAEDVAWALRSRSLEVLVENGGDLFCIVKEPRLIALVVGSASFETILALRIHPKQGPCGVASSSGTAGQSISLGRANLVTVVARTGALADAVATATGNRAHDRCALGECVNFAVSIPGVLGAIAVMDGEIAIRGNLDIASLN